MPETQASIAQWADATFGLAQTNARIVARAMQEVAELVICLANDEANPKATEEAADVAICLTRLGERVRHDVLCEATEFLPSAVPMTASECGAEAAIELALLFGTLGDCDAGAIADAAALVVGWLSRVSSLQGHDLRQAIDVKMAVNRRRQWRRDGHGHGYHVDATTSTAIGTWDDAARRADSDRES